MLELQSLLVLGLSLTPRLVCDAAAARGGGSRGVDGGAAWKFEGWYPNHYVARQLGPAEKITIDGKLVSSISIRNSPML